MGSPILSGITEQVPRERDLEGKDTRESPKHTGDAIVVADNMASLVGLKAPQYCSLGTEQANKITKWKTLNLHLSEVRNW